MVAVILADRIVGKPREHDFWAGQPHQPHQFAQRASVIPGGERPQHVLRTGVLSVQEPDVVDAQGCESAAGFDVAHRAEGPGLFVADVVASRIASGAVHDRDAHMAVQHAAGQEAADRSLVVRMGDDQQQVGAVARIRRGGRRRHRGGGRHGRG